MAKRSFKGPSSKLHITMGLTGLIMSLMLTASFLDLIPDKAGIMHKGRTALAEAVAANSTIFLTRGDYRRMEAVLGLIVERNADILSAAVRKDDGKIVAEIGEHAVNWDETREIQESESGVQVPIWSGETQWGQVELRFEPLRSGEWWGFLDNPLVKLVTFMAVAGFFMFYFYLGKMLKHLDPSEAVPERVRAALDTMAEGLLVLDRKEQVVLANLAFSKLMNRNPTDLMGVKVSDFDWTSTSDAPFENKKSPWRQVLSEGKQKKNEMVRLETPTSGRRTFIVNCAPILGEGNRTGGVLISFDDVTALEEKEIELRKSKDDAEAANRAKSDFLANMSHEIRTPMNAILGFTEVLKRGYGKNRQDSGKYLDTIHSSGKHLLALINDILDLSKVEAGRIEVERIPCDPYIIIREIVQILGIKGQEKGIFLTFEPQGPSPATIFSDPARLRQIITNLVGNSLKFTNQGGVRIVTRFMDFAENPKLAIDIIDTGIGMTEAQQQKIFDPFVQADASVTRQFGGTGLGLSISRRFAEALEGEISVRSDLGKGSVFTVTLNTGPLREVSMLQTEEILVRGGEVTAQEATQWQFSSARILVVDDGDENRELVKLVLEEVGLTVDTAENGQVGCDMALAEPYDMILMDVQMPVMDGYSATRLLRGKKIKIPIFALTAHAMKGIEQKCITAGFNGVMTKPIDIDGLINTLADNLECRRSEYLEETADIPQPAAEPDSDGYPQSVESVIGAPIVSRLPLENPRFAEIIQRFIKRLDVQLGFMDLAWEQKNFEELAGLAHWLKGAGGTVGFDAFTEPAKLLEQHAKNQDEHNSRASLDDLRGLSKRIRLAEEETGAEMAG